MSDLAEIIERLEKASGPSLSLDITICQAVILPSITEWMGSPIEGWFGQGLVFGCNTANGYRHLEVYRCPNFTSSIDVALILVPEGWDWDVSCFPAAWAWPNGSTENIQYVEAATPPLAICAVALRAREATNADQ